MNFNNKAAKDNDVVKGERRTSQKIRIKIYVEIHATGSTRTFRGKAMGLDDEENVEKKKKMKRSQ